MPITFGQEISGWRSMIEHGRDMIRASLDGLYELALGGTAVGTGPERPCRVRRGCRRSRRRTHRPAHSARPPTSSTR
ncbi:MAG: lyase family protein [Evtepia sp.]